MNSKHLHDLLVQVHFICSGCASVTLVSLSKSKIKSTRAHFQNKQHQVVIPGPLKLGKSSPIAGLMPLCNDPHVSSKLYHTNVFKEICHMMGQKSRSASGTDCLLKPRRAAEVRPFGWR